MPWVATPETTACSTLSLGSAMASRATRAMKPKTTVRSTGGSSATRKKSRRRTSAASPRHSTTKHRSKNKVSRPTRSTSMLTAVSVTATPRDTTWRPGSDPTSQNVSPCVTALNLGPISGALGAARRDVVGLVELVGEQLVERGLVRDAGDTVEGGHLGSGQRARDRLDLARLGQ